MSLWIRSQSCENLINNPLRIHYEIGYNEEHRIYANTYDECILIGKYITRERALEVLDEIEKKINLINLGNDFGSPMIDLENPTYIYRMPKE